MENKKWFFFLQRKMVEMIDPLWVQNNLRVYTNRNSPQHVHARSCSPNEASPRECGTEWLSSFAMTWIICSAISLFLFSIFCLIILDKPIIRGAIQQFIHSCLFFINVSDPKDVMQNVFSMFREYISKETQVRCF